MNSGGVAEDNDMHYDDNRESGISKKGTFVLFFTYIARGGQLEYTHSDNHSILYLAEAD